MTAADHTYAMIAAIELAPSSAAIPRRTPPSIARWNGNAHHVTTGVANASDTHCQPSNWAGSKYAITNTGMVSTSANHMRAGVTISRAV